MESLPNYAKERFMQKTYPGYPEKRLIMQDITTMPRNYELELPEGPWEASRDELPSGDETQHFIDMGYSVDAKGRPLHPWLPEMISNPDIGVVTGKGFYWNWGPNYTADPVVIRKKEGRRQILLIQRGDTGDWALPGGFVDKDEDALVAAVREVEEETGLRIKPDGTKVYEGVVADLRSTAHAWAETTAFVFETTTSKKPIGADDARDAGWYFEDELPESLHGSHAIMIKKALSQLRKQENIQQIANHEQFTVSQVAGGHMAYDHLIIETPVQKIFVKSHDSDRFDDEFREAHSRQYLQKEFTYLLHLSEQSAGLVPSNVALFEDTDLAMEALHEDEGWHWRRPEDEMLHGKYINDIINALTELQSIPLPEALSYREVINDTFETFWREGWNDISEEKSLVTLHEKIFELSRAWDDERRNVALNLAHHIPILGLKAQKLKTLIKSPQYFAHHDIRQSNIAWHPEEGVRIVDWSWADPGLENSDITTFLVDMKKAGHDIEPYLDKINTDHLLIMIGFWLSHTLWQTRDGDTTVREQQLASACAAFEILENLA